MRPGFGVTNSAVLKTRACRLWGRKDPAGDSGVAESALRFCEKPPLLPPKRLPPAALPKAAKPEVLALHASRAFGGVSADFALRADT